MHSLRIDGYRYVGKAPPIRFRSVVGLRQQGNARFQDALQREVLAAINSAHQFTDTSSPRPPPWSLNRSSALSRARSTTPRN
jgi:hypothetical protein